MTEKKMGTATFRQAPRALNADEIERVAGGPYNPPGIKDKGGPDNQSKNFPE